MQSATLAWIFAAIAVGAAVAFYRGKSRFVNGLLAPGAVIAALTSAPGSGGLATGLLQIVFVPIAAVLTLFSIGGMAMDRVEPE